MFKLTLTLVTLAAFQGVFASPIPQNVNGVANVLGGVAGSLTGLTSDLPAVKRQLGEIQNIDQDLTGLLKRQNIDDSLLEEGLQNIEDDENLRKRQVNLPVVGPILSGLPVVGGLVGGATGGSGLLKRQLGGVDLGSVVHDAIVDIPGVVSTVAGAVERPITGLLTKRQLGGLPTGGVLDTVNGALSGVPAAGSLGSVPGESLVSGLLKRQIDGSPLGALLGGLPDVGGLVAERQEGGEGEGEDEDEDEVLKRQNLPVVGPASSGLPVVGGLLNGVTGEFDVNEAVGSVINDVLSQL